MSDHDALLAAICADPDEDTPRLAFADWLDENDQSERAAFVRAQIELARTPPWEPFAVMCRWRKPDLVSGKSFRHTLPAVDGFHVSWPHDAFRRGFGWRLNVASPGLWEQTEPRILGRAPVGEMHLHNAPLIEDWQQFAASAVMPSLRKLHFVSSPIDGLRVLRETPAALGITDIYFERASGAGMPVVVEDLLGSPLGKVVRGLHFHIGYESLFDLIDSLHLGQGLERLSFSVMGLTADHLRYLCDGSTLSELVELNISDEPFGNDGIRVLAGALPASLQTLRLSHTGGQADGLEVLTQSRQLAGLRRLDLSRNPLAPRAIRVLASSRSLAGLRSLDLHECRIGDKGVRRLTRAKFWPRLVELDLRGNVISPAGMQHLLDAELPPDLTAIVLDGEQLGSELRNELRKKYAERVLFGV
ncbi:MAG: TIGR02996 domain-containing protein [Planctomycetes bacterium]|nr:TIGR02996 domain-containing protein [Planctomycetota bacterium]